MTGLYSILYCLFIWFGVFNGIEVTPKEYCNMETFEAKCPENELVIMKSAVYGRMRIGKCVDSAFGFVGCKADVLGVADGKCSGRQNCKIKLPDDDIYAYVTTVNECPKEVASYLEAAYTCQPVEENLSAKCSSGIPIILSASSGYLTNAHAGPTSSRCIWNVRLLPGQRINITLFDFGVTRHQASISGRPLMPPGCYKYAVIREMATASLASKDSVVCSGVTRERVVYMSESHSIEVTTMYVGIATVGGSGHEDSIMFLLKYEAVGCADLQVSGQVIARREADRVLLYCDNTTVKHYLVCSDGKWTGDIPLCPLHNNAKPDQGMDSFWTDMGFSNESALEEDEKKQTSSQRAADDETIVITVGIGMALGVVIGSVLLLVLLAYCRSRELKQSVYNGDCEEEDQLKTYARSIPMSANETPAYFDRSAVGRQINTDQQQLQYPSEAKTNFGPIPPSNVGRQTDLHEPWMTQINEGLPSQTACPTSGYMVTPSIGRPSDRQLGRYVIGKGFIQPEHVYELTG